MTSKALAARFSNTQVLIEASSENWLAHNMQQASVEMANVERMTASTPVEMMDSFWPEAGSWMSYYKPYVVSNGVLQIPVKGVLLHDFGLSFGSYATGYTYIRKAFERGLTDPAVQRIAFVVNSGGGEVAGNFDLADIIYANRGVKPMAAFVNEHAYSAAFSLASAVGKVIVPRTGGTGSVGVLTSHTNLSKALDEAGVDVTFVFAGKHKVDGNSTEALSPAAKNKMQERVDALYDVFVSTVARNLGMTEQAVRDTEALTYTAAESIEVGFAHEIRPIDEAMTAFASDHLPTVGVTTMSEKEQQKPSAISTADLDAARAEGRSQGVTAERQRISGIMGCAEAAGRNALCTHLAMNTDMSVEAAQGILASSPVEAAAPVVAEAVNTGAAFEAAMSAHNPELGAGSGDGGDSQASASSTLLADYQAYVGKGA